VLNARNQHLWSVEHAKMLLPSRTKSSEMSITAALIARRSIVWKDIKRNVFFLEVRKLLYRAGTLLQEGFYLYMEKVFDKLVTKIETRGGKIYIYEGNYTRQLVGSYDALENFPLTYSWTSKTKMHS
jgi:hypothetical protein